MPKKSNVDIWLERETKTKRTSLENASRYFDDGDSLTVNLLEAIYGQESSFGVQVQMRERGIKGAAGHFHLEKKTAEDYGLIVTKRNDQRFDINAASSAAARYLKDLDRIFGKKTTLIGNRVTIPIKDVAERKKFVLVAYNGGQGTIAKAQEFTKQMGADPQLWNDVERFLEVSGVSKTKTREIKEYLSNVLLYEGEFARKSPADKKAKKKEPKKTGFKCTDGRWITKEDRKIMICDGGSA